MISLQSITNNKDGHTANAVLAGLVGGETVGFWASRSPEKYSAHGTSVSWTLDNDTGAFVLDFGYVAYEDGLNPTRLYYVWGEIDDVMTDAIPVWVGVSDDDELNEIMNKLVERIRLNAPAINVRLASYYPELSLKQVIHGRFPQLSEYACIEVHANSMESPYYAVPMIRRNTVSAEISGFIPSDEPRSMDNVSTAFGRSVQQIMNQPDYEKMTLDSGNELTGCQASSLRLDYTMESGRYYASWTLSWTGEYSGVNP